MHEALWHGQHLRGSGPLGWGWGLLWQGFPKLSSFCSSHRVARRLLGIWGPPSPGTPSQAHCGISWEAAFQLLGFFSLLIWVMHNQNKHTEEKPTQPEGLFLSWCVQLSCGVASVFWGGWDTFPYLHPLFRAGPLWGSGVRSIWHRSFCQGLGCSLAWGCCGISTLGAALKHCLALLRLQPAAGLRC